MELENLTLDETVQNCNILTLNIRSIPSNFDCLLALLAIVKIKYDLIVIIETWLNDEHEGLYEIDGYSHVSLNRPGRGGGIRLYYLTDIIVEVIDCLTDIFVSHESLFVKVSLPKSRNFIVGCIYRPPNNSSILFNNTVRNALKMPIMRKKVVIVGDFNIDLLKLDCNLNVRNFRDIMIAEGFKTNVKKPSRCKAQTGLPTSLIDHVWCNFELQNVTNTMDYLIGIIYRFISVL